MKFFTAATFKFNIEKILLRALFYLYFSAHILGIRIRSFPREALIQRTDGEQRGIYADERSRKHDVFVSAEVQSDLDGLSVHSFYRRFDLT